MIRWARRARMGLMVFEAALWLAIARFALFALRFATLASFLDRPFAARETEEPRRGAQRRRIARAVDIAAGLLPGRTVCFPRGLAAFMMCRVRRIGSVLHYGAAVFPGEGMRAHVWLMDGNYGITGHSVANAYCVLARFPSAIGPGVRVSVTDRNGEEENRSKT